MWKISKKSYLRMKNSKGFEVINVLLKNKFLKRYLLKKWRLRKQRKKRQSKNFLIKSRRKEMLNKELVQDRFKPQENYRSRNATTFPFAIKEKNANTSIHWSHAPIFQDASLVKTAFTSMSIAGTGASVFELTAVMTTIQNQQVSSA